MHPTLPLRLATCSESQLSVNVRKHAKVKQASFSRLADLSERYNNRDQLPFKIWLKGYAGADEESAIRLKIVRNP